MGKKIRAAKASLVAAFLAAGGTAAAKAVPAGAATPASADRAGPAAALPQYLKYGVSWGDPLVRFLKLDGFPAYLKVDSFEQLTNYYKDALLSDASALYVEWGPQVQGLLDLYNKANAGPLSGILIGLEQYIKFENTAPFYDYVKTDEGLNAYIKFQSFYGALEEAARADEKGGSALQFFQKLTGISYLPAVQSPNPE